SMSKPNVAQSLLIERVGIQDDDQLQKAVYADLIDGYGQSTRGRWPEKIVSDDQLKAAAAREQQQLKGWLAERSLLSRDTYGGVTTGPAFDAKGFFRTEKRDGRWYLVTPEGHPFYSLGVNTVAADGGRTYVAGRESMFSALPQAGQPLAQFYGEGNNNDGNGSSSGRQFNQGRWFDFYAANLERSYGKPCTPVAATATTAAVECPAPVLDIQRWQGHSLDRLQAWGFNTLGNWSDPGLGHANRLPYTLPLSIVGDYTSISTGMDWWGSMPDPFDPRFAMATERAVAIAARDHRDDPWLIGYFADNELAWAAPGNDPKTRYALAYGTLRLTTDVPAKRAFLKQLRDKYRNQEGLSKAWGINLPAWELMEDPGFEPPLPSPEHPEIEADFQYFQKVFAETYFKTIADSLKWHAPNHLLLGGRFAVSTPEAVAACAEFCDVLSFNFYTPKPQDGYDFAQLNA
ncbi:MAG: beta-agarase, partial [Pseudomonas sp.]